MKASPAAVPSTASTSRQLGARHLLAVVEQQRALGAERHRHEAVAALQHLKLVAVDDGEVGVDVDRPRGRGVQAEEPGRLLPRADDGCVRDLELAEHGVALRRARSRRPPRSLPGRRRSGSRRPASTRIIATPVGAGDAGHAGRRAAPPRGRASSAKASSADRADEGHVGPEPRARRRPGSLPCRPERARTMAPVTVSRAAAASPGDRSRLTRRRR